MREISWRLREIGADSRICDIIDSQATAIEAATGEISSSPVRDAQDAAFAAIEQRIAEFSRSDDSVPTRPDANVVPFPAPAEEVAAAVIAPVTAAEPVAKVGKFLDFHRCHGGVNRVRLRSQAVFPRKTVSDYSLPRLRRLAVVNPSESHYNVPSDQ